MIIADKTGRRSNVVGSVASGFASRFSHKTTLNSAAWPLVEFGR